MLKRIHKIFLALLFVFLAPGIFAVLFYYNPTWLKGLPTNKGTLIRPAKDMSFLNIDTSAPKWHIMQNCKAGCDTECLNQLDSLARMRLALGRRLYHVELWLLLPKGAPVCTQETEVLLHSEAIKVRELTPAEQDKIRVLNVDASVFVVDAKGYMILAYPQVDDAQKTTKDIYQDLKRLLNTQEQAT